MFVPGYTEQQARRAVENSSSYAETLRRLGLRPAGGNHRLLRHYVDDVWAISTQHFDPRLAQRKGLRRGKTPLGDVLVEHSTYSRHNLKRRLFAAGLKTRQCELCGQGETWRGKHMAMILDHINGVADDNRLENLRVVCPNCSATFDTHCGRKNRLDVFPRVCVHCDGELIPNYPTQRYCSQACGVHSRKSRAPRPETRKVERPPREQLIAETAELGFSAVGRRYGVSDNAVRKWLRWYEARRRAEAGGSQTA
jgi:hypothetical protein